MFVGNFIKFQIIFNITFIIGQNVNFNLIINLFNFNFSYCQLFYHYKLNLNHFIKVTVILIICNFALVLKFYLIPILLKFLTIPLKFLFIVHVVTIL